ncbi:sensor histidine kinase [Aminipila terrae]|uniref:GHKL domain-containing protein n=1 Tax=Aminipila terrae TaxID=2697030 RepID=A0A6P1MEA0_9FIRM|nr:GHKL domain-containing protein [Aminipila terrae]QHI73019.1 GHKL domain-containing protein [Aminipila terrae]
MMNIIYMTISQMVVLLVLLFVVKYIFMEIKFSNNRAQKIYFTAGIVLMLVAAILDNQFEFISVLITIFLFEVAVFTTRKKKRIRGLLLIIPVLGIVISYIMLPIALLYLFIGSMNDIIFKFQYTMKLLDIFCWGIILLFYIRGKKCRKELKNTIEKYHLDKWETRVLSTIGVFLFLLSILISSADELNIPVDYSKVLVFVSATVVLLLNIAIIGLVFQRYAKYQYQNTAELNEYYLNLQLEHFKIYQETQRETRRIRHDMKNHTGLMNQLAQTGSYKELKEYLLKLNDQVEHIDQELHLGNEIVDAIVNEKSVQAGKLGITIVTEGVLPDCFKIEPIDLCTIFANAIDNGVEELHKINIQEKKLEIHIVNHNSMNMISFQNITKQQSKTQINTWKQDKLNHGFGIENIRRAVEKYNGYIEYGVHERENNFYFRLDVILF